LLDYFEKKKLKILLIAKPKNICIFTQH